MSKGKNTKSIIILAVMALAVVVGGILFVGATAGWFDNKIQKVMLDEEYRQTSKRIDIENIETLENLLSNQKTFIITSYLPTCTANIISFMKDYSESRSISYYHISWSDLRKTSLKEKIDFPPTVMVISNGNIIDALRSDSDKYLDQYDNYEAFKTWLDGLISV